MNFRLITETYGTLVLLKKHPNDRNHRKESGELTFRVSDEAVLHLEHLCQIQTQSYPSKAMEELAFANMKMVKGGTDSLNIVYRTKC